MPQKRPDHLVARRATDPQLSTKITHRATAGQRNTYGEWAEAEPVDTEIRCATYPATADDERARELMAAGIDLTAIRVFITTNDITVVADAASGDIIIHNKTHYRAHSTARWEERFSATHAVRIDPDPHAAPAGTEPLERAVRAFVAAGSNIPTTKVVPANGIGPRPLGVHASVLLQQDRRESWPIQHWTPDTAPTAQTGDGTLEVTVPRTSTFHADFYGPGAATAARQFTRWAETDPGLDWPVNPQDPGGGDWPPFVIDFPLAPLRLDELVDDRWEERVHIEINVRHHDWFTPETSTVAAYEGSLVTEHGTRAATTTLTG